MEQPPQPQRQDARQHGGPAHGRRQRALLAGGAQGLRSQPPGIGVGAGGYTIARKRYRRDTLEVHHAHGYVVQTLADFGLAGLAVSLALLAAFLAAAGRTVALRPGAQPDRAPYPRSGSGCSRCWRSS